MPSRADAHRHQHIKKWRLDFQNAWTHLIDEIEENFVVGQIAEGGHEKLRIKSDGKIAPLIHYRKRFAGLAHLRRVGGDLDVVLAETELDRIRFVARQQRYPAQRVEKGLAFERDTLLRFRRNHLFVIRIIAFDQFRDQQRTIKIECDLTGAHADLHVAIIGKQACQFRDCFCRNNDVRFVTARKFQFENDSEEASRRQRGRARLVYVRFETSTHTDIEIGGGEIDRSLFCLQQNVGKNRERGPSADDVLNLLQSFQYFLFRRAEFHSESLRCKALLLHPQPLSQSALKRAVNERDGLPNVVLLYHPFLHQLAGVQDGAMIAAAKCIPNFIK